MKPPSKVQSATEAVEEPVETAPEAEEDVPAVKVEINQKQINEKKANVEKIKYLAKRDDWSEKTLDNFLETLRKQPAEEMNDRRNKWIMFAKRLEKKAQKDQWKV